MAWDCLGGMTVEGYEEAIPRVVPVAQALAKRGAKVISVFGSSLTFYKGAKFNEELTQRVTKATGLPATTQSNGLVDGLRTVNAKRVALATVYTDIVTGRLKVFLEEHGFEVTSAKGLGYERIPEGAATQEILFKLGADAYANSRKADALVMSCGALRTLDLIVPLESKIAVPVVSSTPHGLMNVVRLLGVNPRAQGFGMVFARAVTRAAGRPRYRLNTCRSLLMTTEDVCSFLIALAAAVMLVGAPRAKNRRRCSGGIGRCRSHPGTDGARAHGQRFCAQRRTEPSAGR